MKQHPTFTRYHLNDSFEIEGPRKILTPAAHHTGYLVYSVFTDDKKQRQMRAHRMVWECYHGKLIPEGMQINHIDGNKHNNAIENLELCTVQENLAHRDKTGLGNWQKGSDHYASKVAEEEIFNLFRDLQNGMSNREAGDKYGLHPRYVSLIRHKRRRQHEWQLFERSETIREEYVPSGTEAVGAA